MTYVEMIEGAANRGRLGSWSDRDGYSGLRALADKVSSKTVAVVVDALSVCLADKYGLSKD